MGCVKECVCAGGPEGPHKPQKKAEDLVITGGGKVSVGLPQM